MLSIQICNRTLFLFNPAAQLISVLKGLRNAFLDCIYLSFKLLQSVHRAIQSTVQRLPTAQHISNAADMAIDKGFELLEFRIPCLQVFCAFGKQGFFFGNHKLYFFGFFRGQFQLQLKSRDERSMRRDGRL